MLRLREQQFELATALMGDATGILGQVANNSRVPAMAAISVYRNNLKQGFGNALALTFPVLVRLVGEPYFRQLADQFRRRHPSRSGNLSNIGSLMPEFLRESFEHTEYHYFADIARLEWLVYEVQCAAEAPWLSVDAFKAMTPAECSRLRFRMHPAARMMKSVYPILRIWQSNQPGADPVAIDLGSGGDLLIISRTKAGTRLHSLEAALYELAFALAAGASLGDGYDAAAKAAGTFDLAQALHRLLCAGTFTQFLEHNL